MDQIEVNSQELALLFNMTDRRVSQLVKEGVLKRTTTNSRKYDLEENIKSYIGFLQAKANGRTPASEAELKVKKLEVDIALKESQAELHKLKTDIQMGRYVSTEELEADYTKFFITFKKFCMNLPARVIGLVAGQLEPVEARKLEKEISDEIGFQLNSFVMAGKEREEVPPIEQKRKRGRPKKVSGT